MKILRIITKKTIFVFLVIVFFVAFCFPLLTHASGYTYQRTIQDCQTSTCPANQSNFTILVCANGTVGNGNSCPTVTGLNQSGGGAHVQNASGDDIVFSSTSCSSPTLMNWEMDHYDPTTGEMEAWVKIPSLTSTGDTIYMCYGNSSVSTFQGGSTGSAWDSNYVAIYHLGDGSTLSGNDSSTTGANVSIVGSGVPIAGMVSGGWFTYGNGSSQTAANEPALNFTTGNFTADWWQYELNNDNVIPVNQGQYEGNGWYAYENTIVTLQTAYAQVATGNILSTGVWQHIAIVRNGPSTAAIYLNGVPQITSGSIQNPVSDTSDPFQVNSSYDPIFGYLDDVRVSNTDRSQNWIDTEYNNESAPATFLSVSSEQDPNAPATTYTFTNGGSSSGATGAATPTLTVAPNGAYTGTITITPTGSAATGLSPVVKTFSNSGSPQTLTFTPTVAGTLTLTPTNNGGLSPDASALTYTVSNTAPSAPQSLAAAPGVTNVSLTWTAPVTNGGSAITHYLVYDRPTGGGSYTLYATLGSSALSDTVTGLTNGTSYDFEVFAENAIGTSPASSSVSTTPTNEVSSTTGGGNWSSTSTWIGGVVPGDGDFVTIQGPVVIDQNVGTTGGGGVKTITLTTGAQLSLNNSAPRAIYFASTGTDGVGSGSLRFPGQDATMFGFLIYHGDLSLVGTQADPVTIEAANGTGPIYFDKQYDFVMPTDATLTLKYADIYNLGSSAGGSQDGIDWDASYQTSASAIDVENSRFTNPYELIDTQQGTGPITFSNNYITGRTGPNTFQLTNPYNSTATITITGNTEVSPGASGWFVNSNGYSTHDATISGNAVEGTPTAFMGGVYESSGSSTSGDNTIQYNIFYNDPSWTVPTGSENGWNTSYLGLQFENSPNSTADSNIVEGATQSAFGGPDNVTNNFFSQQNYTGGGQGEIILWHSNGVDIAHNVFYLSPADPNLATNNGVYTLNASDITIEHDTFVGGSDVNVGDPAATGNSSIVFGELSPYNTGLIARSNLASHDSWGIYDRNSNTYTADFNGVGVHHNDVFDNAYGTYYTDGTATNFQNGSTAHPDASYGDITADPGYFDSTRTSVLQYDSRVLGGPGTEADLFGQLAERSGWGGTYSSTALATATSDDNNPINDIREWLFAGYAPTNVALATSGADSTPDGAVAMAAGSTVPGAPTSVSASAGNTQATVTFSAPSSNGGATIDGYTVTSIPSGGTDSNANTTSLSHVITGLTNLTSYTFTVTAHNSVGTGSASSPSSAVIPTAGLPTASAVSITGTKTIGQTLTGHYTFFDSNGQSDTSTFQWLRASSSGGSYSNISGATSLTYILTSADIGQYLEFKVTPISASGTGSAVTSSPTTQINSSAAPTASSVNITGTQTEGDTLTGHYTYAQADSVAEGVSTFRWLESTTSGGTYSAIGGATSNTYPLAPTDVGKFIKFEVTPVAVYPVTTGSATTSSATGAIVASSTPVASAVSVTGTLTSGQTLTGHYTYSDSGSHPEATSTFRWLSSTTSGGSYSPIGGATSSTYTLQSSDVGNYIRFEVTPVSTVATGSPVQSSPTTQIQNTGVPTASSLFISGVQANSQTLTANYTYSDPGNFTEGASTFQWLESTTSGGSYSPIGGATSNTYVLQSGDIGMYLEFEVTPVSTVPPTTGSLVVSSPTGVILAVAPSSGGGGGGGGGTTGGVSYLPPTSTGSTPPPAATAPTLVTTPTPTNTIPTTTTYDFGTVTLKDGSTGDAVKELQIFLNNDLKLGLVVDGKLGPATIDVIKQWQADHGLVPDGLVGNKTKALMNSFAPTTTSTTQTGPYNFGSVTLQLHSTGAAVKELQLFLNSSLNLNMTVDGVFGQATVSAVEKWQTAHGLTADGAVGEKTKGEMLSSSQ